MYRYIVVLLFLLGCNNNHKENADSRELKVIAFDHVIKLGYLPNLCGHAEHNSVLFAIDAQHSEGNLTLLDDHTGRYAYIPSLKNGIHKDRFHYSVTCRYSVREGVVEMDIQKPIVLLNEEKLQSFSSNLPIVAIDTGDQEIPDEPKTVASMAIFEPDQSQRATIEAAPAYRGFCAIEIRGSFSQHYPKKQYAFNSVTSEGEKLDISLLGMPKEHKWILNAPYVDKSLMRNYLAYHKTREIDEKKYFAVRSQFVELLMRVRDHYRYDGVYLLMEKIKRDKHRIDIKKLKKSDILSDKISGGYILQQGKIKAGDLLVPGLHGMKYIIEYPDAQKINDAQRAYIQNYILEFESALLSDDYEGWIDEESFVVHILAREFFRDFDDWKYSEYFYKVRGGPLSLGPIWDFNVGMGNNGLLGYNGSVTGWDFSDRSSGTGLWIDTLMHDTIFRSKVARKWRDLRKGIWSDGNLTDFIDKTKKVLSEAAGRNFRRWDVLGRNILFSNRKACSQNGRPVYCDTFESAVDQHLKVWLLGRAHWMDLQLQ